MLLMARVLSTCSMRALIGDDFFGRHQYFLGIFFGSGKKSLCEKFLFSIAKPKMGVREDQGRMECEMVSFAKV